MRCPGCAADIDVLSARCPHCGASTDRAFADPPRSVDPRRPGERSPQELARNRKTILWIAGGIALLLAASGHLNPFGHHLTFGPHAIHIDTGDEPHAPVTVAAADLFEAYHTDSDAARRRFGDREMVVTGTFVRTVPDGYGSIDMRLATNHPDMPLGIDLDSHSVDAATRLEPGQPVTVSCRRVAGTGDDPWLEDCVIQPGSDQAPAASPAPPAAPQPPARSADAAE